MMQLATRAICRAMRSTPLRFTIPMSHSIARATPSPSSRCSLHSTHHHSAFTYPSSRSLGEIVKLEKLIPHTRDEIVHIWESHHNLARNAATTSDTINTAEYDTFIDRAKKAPLFVVPCFRLAPQTNPSEPFTFDTSGGFEMMLINVQTTSILVTSLEEYRSKGASDATPYAVITLYPDMSQSKDLILIRAEMMDVNVAIPQLQQLWHLIKHHYITDASAFAEFPESFNRKPNPQFDFDKYIEECKKIVKELKLVNTKATLSESNEAAPFEAVKEAEVEDSVNKK